MYIYDQIISKYEKIFYKYENIFYKVELFTQGCVYTHIHTYLSFMSMWVYEKTYKYICMYEWMYVCMNGYVSSITELNVQDMK